MYAGLDPEQLHPRASNLATLFERLVRELDASVDPSANAEIPATTDPLVRPICRVVRETD